jgi:glycerol-3-phosphate dehydrogenase
MKTAELHGAFLLNYARVEKLIKKNQKVVGVEVYDVQLKQTFSCLAKVVVNAAGVFVDHLLQQDTVDQAPMVAPSQGIHIVVDKKYFPGIHALMIPKTDDGRVLFVVPWLDKAVIGTTDTPVQSAQAEPIAFQQEIDFVLQHVSRYSKSPIGKADVLSVFAGLRPLVKSSNAGGPTSLLSRDHTIMVNPSGLITITGGKWTTYRKMAKDAVENVLFVAKLGKKPCVTEDLAIHNKYQDQAYHLLLESDNGSQKLHEDYPYLWADVAYAVLYEQARTIEDVLARRTRFLFLDAVVTNQLIEPVAKKMQLLLEWSEEKLEEEINHMKELVSCYSIQ